jgi:hypothetical protein
VVEMGSKIHVVWGVRGLRFAVLEMSFRW